jgi:stalled ribosome rescue protein Dom34
MLGDAAERINRLARENAWVLIGGIHVVATDLHGRLDKRLTTLSAVIPLDVHDSEARLADAAREHVSRLREADDLGRLEDVLSASAKGGTGAVGLQDIDQALLNGQVHELFITSKFFTERPDEAMAAIRRAFDGSATVEHVSGAAAERLDAAGGIAARLRFVLSPRPAESVT